MASSGFVVLPALEADMGDIGSIFTVSFADDHILGPANANVAPDLLCAADLEFIKELWRTREAFNARFFKVVDLDTRLVYLKIIIIIILSSLLSLFQLKKHEYDETRKLKQNSASKTIAFSKWNYPTFSTLRPQEAGMKKMSYPQGADVELLDDYYAQMWSKRAKWMDPANVFCKSFTIIIIILQ